MQLEKWLEEHNYIEEDVLRRLQIFLDRLKHEKKEVYDRLYECLEEDEKIEDITYEISYKSFVKIYNNEKKETGTYVKVGVIAYVVVTDSMVYFVYTAKYDLNGNFFDEYIKNFYREFVTLEN